MRQDRYNTGWNDTAYGIITWADGCSATYATPQEWAAGMKKIAEEMKAKGEDGYYSGCIAAADHYLATGCIDTKLVA